jgi:hypothetical protein
LQKSGVDIHPPELCPGKKAGLLNYVEAEQIDVVEVNQSCSLCNANVIHFTST